MERQWVRLRDPSAQFWDSVLKFGLSRDEVKQLPENIPAGSLTARCWNAGGFIPCDPPAGAKSAARSADPAEVEDAGAQNDASLATTREALAAARDQVIERRIGVLKEQSMKDLRQAAKDLGLKIGAAISKDMLAAMVAVAEWQRGHGAEREEG